MKKSGTVEVVCTGIGCMEGVKKIPADDFYKGFRCNVCGRTYQTVDQHKPHTHKSSKERHGGHSHVTKTDAKSAGEKRGKK